MQSFPIVSGWRCNHSGECCRDVVMTHAEWNAIAAIRRVPLPEAHPDPRFVQYVGVCPLLQVDNKCSVYGARPMNCRRFMCLRVPGEVFDASGPMGCRNLSDRIAQSRTARRQYAQNQAKAQRYGLKHGWTQDMVDLG